MWAPRAKQSPAKQGRGRGHPNPRILLLPDLVPTPKCCQGQISAPPLLQEPPSTPRAHCTPVPSSMEIQALPLQRYSPRREALNQNCAFSCLVQGGRDPRVTFVSVSGHREEQGKRLSAHDGGAARLIPVHIGRVGCPSPILMMGTRERGKRHAGTKLGRHWLRKPWGVAPMGRHPWAYWHEPTAAKGPGQGISRWGLDLDPTRTLRNRGYWRHPHPLHSCSCPAPHKELSPTNARQPIKPAPREFTDRKDILAPRCSLASQGDPGGQWGQRVSLL